MYKEASPKGKAKQAEQAKKKSMPFEFQGTDSTVRKFQ